MAVREPPTVSAAPLSWIAWILGIIGLILALVVLLGTPAGAVGTLAWGLLATSAAVVLAHSPLW